MKFTVKTVMFDGELAPFSSDQIRQRFLLYLVRSGSLLEIVSYELSAITPA